MGLGISTSSKKNSRYPDEIKACDGIKIKFNNKIALFCNDLKRYYLGLCGDDEERNLFVEQFWCVVLDGASLGTTKTLVEAGVVTVDKIDICSHNVRFQGPNPENYHTCNLSEMLAANTRHRYSCLVFDFCGSWSPEQKKCLEIAISNELIADIAILAVTLCHRNGNSPIEYYHQHYETFLKDLNVMLSDSPYRIGYQQLVQNSHVMSWIFKVMHVKNAMAYDGGISFDKKGRATDVAWLQKKPKGEGLKSAKKKIKR
jgi:hypothetical protein